MPQNSTSLDMSSFGNVLHAGNNQVEQHRESTKSDYSDTKRKRRSSEHAHSMQSRAYETHGIRLVPAEVIFYNAFRGQCYTTVLTIVNISTHTMHLSISQPYSSAFHIKDPGTSIAIAPGLSITRKITYKCAEGQLFDTVIPIRVGQSLILLPVKVVPGQVQVLVEPTTINFGRIDLGSAFVTKSVHLHNKGSIAAKYTIDLSKNELDIMITPRSGTIKPYSTVVVKIQLAGLVVGEHETEFWVKTTPACRFLVWVTVVVPFLKAIHPFATEEFTLLDMQPTFPGTCRYSTLLVRNSSSEMSSVVVSCECDGLVMSPALAAQEDPCFKHFRLQPYDGTLAPFENRIFTMWFCPRAPEYERGWKRLRKESTSQYLCFFRIQRVTVTHSEEGTDQKLIPQGEERCQLQTLKEISEDEPTLSTRTLNSLDTREKNNIIRVCAYSSYITPRLYIVPDELIFENVKIGQKIDRVLRLHNPCELPLGFSYVKQAHISVVNNDSDFIQPNKSVEILVQFHPRSLQFNKNRLVFNLLSHKNLTDQTNVVVIGQVSIKLTISIKAESKALLPTFLPGITPRVHLEGEEVGLHTETVQFSNVFYKSVDIPNAVVWPESTTEKPWLSSDARVAFPNERRRSLRVTSHDGNVRSIFTGKTRYNVPPDPTNVYSPKELEFKVQHDNKYRKYVAHQASKKLEYFKMLDADHSLPAEYDIDDEKLYSLLGTFPPVPVPEFKLKSDRPIDHDVLCPLTPMQLFNIKVQPQIVDFGKMPPKTDCSTNIAVDNMNTFPIAVRFRTYKESLKVPGGAFVVPANSTKIQKITLFLEANGKHYTNMSYIINTYHSYDIKVCAEVETRFLITEPGELSFRETSEKEIFEKNILPVKLTNPLGSKSMFKWKMSPGSSFGVVPSQGIVPARSSLTCSVFFNLKSGNQLGSVLVLQVEDGLGSHFPVNFLPSNKFSLTLFSPKISCPNISLGIRFTKKIIIYNHGRRPAYFSLDDMELPKSMKVVPLTGTVPSRACYTLTVQLFFLEVKKFSYKIPINSMSQRNINLTCNGFVSYPMVTFHPKRFLFRTTPVHSHTSASFTVTNESEAEVKVKFSMAEFPQFMISTSADFADRAAGLGDQSTTLAGLETKTLYLHFEPHDIAGYSFYLPVVINNILGPPVMSDPMSLLPSSYVTVPDDDNKPSAVRISGMSAPEKLDTITVEVAVQRGYIKCSSFAIEFFKTDFKEKGGQTLSIENILLRGEVTIRIKTQNLDPFVIQAKNDSMENMEQITLGEKDKLELTVLFQPTCAGTYSAGVPIYVDEYCKDRPYTVVKMTGVFYRSSLTCVCSMANFIPVCVDVEIDKIIYIVANHQPEDCNLSVEIVGVKNQPLDEYFTVIFPSTNQIPYGIDNFVIPVKIKFRSEIPVSLVAILTARDGYDGECIVTITAIADRSTLTTHAFQFINSLPKLETKDCSVRSLTRDRKQQSSNDRSNMSVSDSNPRVNIGTTHNYEEAAESEIDNLSPITGLIIEEVEQFPLFPKSVSDSSYAKHMRRTKKSMEDWLYEQGFQGQFRMVIGEDVFHSEQYQSALHSTNKNKHFGDVQSVVDLIVKLTGREFTAQYPLPPNIPQDKAGRIGHSIIVYKAILMFLMRQGGKLVHVSPLYLLDYDDYKYYHDKLKPLHIKKDSHFHYVSQMNVVMKRDVYERLRIQCWLDVFLQLYKVLVFYPTMSETQKLSDIAVRSSGSIDKINPKAKPKLQSKLSNRAISLTIAENEKGEENLLSWMNEVFAVNRPNCVPPRRISNFSQDLEDGIFLSLITSHFTPYLQEQYWNNIYWNPANKSESQQNLGILSLAWNKIRIGLSMKPPDMTSPHSVKMIMLCCLLYSVLPTYLPHDTLSFEACLADTVHKHVKLTNPAEHSIGYTVEKFDHYSAFSLANHKKGIYIKAGGSFTLDISFFAKSINKVCATLVLCGSYLPGGFAKNLVFFLKGVPVKLQHKFAVNITCPLYKTAKVKANLNSPFTTEGEFSISITESEPKPGKYKMKLWSQMNTRKLIRPIYLSQTSMEIPASMELPVPLNIYAGALQLKTKEYWIIFSSPKVGDFVVKVSIVPDTRAPQHILHPPFPTKRCNAPPDKTCEDPSCPRIIHIQIPSKNIRLWTAAKAMLSHTLNDVEKTFWDDYLETPLGLKLMAWISRQYHIGPSDMNFLFQSRVTYKVECNSPQVVCPSSITIEDVRSDKTVDLPIHISNAAKPSSAVDIKLRTDFELRYYQIIMRKPSRLTTQSSVAPTKEPSQAGDQVTCNFPCQNI